MKKFNYVLAIALIVVCALTTLIACDDKGGGDNPSAPTTLATPQNVEMSDAGVITWTAVQNATSYTVVLNGNEFETTNTSYQVAQSLLVNDIRYSVYAKANGYNNSAKSEEGFFKGKGVTPKPQEVKVSISKTAEIKSGKSVTYKAYIDGVEAKDGEITWSISEGKSYATIDGTGKVTATEVTGDKKIKIVARSTKNTACYAEKEVWIVARTDLTADMLATLNHARIGFEGYDSIDLFKTDMFNTFVRTVTLPIRTAMDGNNWYAEYEDSSSGIKTGLYYKNVDGKANQVSISFMNEEQPVPMMDENDQIVSWEDAGLYNSLTNLSIDDFKFDETLWRWMYKNSGDTLSKRLVSSATPYDFEVNQWGLIIDEGEIVAIYVQSKDDYQIVEGYKAVQELYLAINTSESLEVPTINKFTHDEQYDELYARLQTAIDNMRALDSYKLDFYEMTSSQFGSSYKGFVETVTNDLCYFHPYNVKYDNSQNEIRTYEDNASYGYKKISDNLYNAYSENAKTEESDPTTYTATRAYQNSFDKARPSFAFSSEIFTSYAYDEDANTYTYYANEAMCGVASTFYYGVGNDINLYGIFATKGVLINTTFTPFVVVKDGYITESCFYFYLGSMFGVVSIKYSDFNTATIPESVNVSFDTRQVPTSWDQLTIIKRDDESSSTSNDTEVNALDYLKEFLGKDNAGEILPFFGDVLGDSYGFGMMLTKVPGGSKTAKNALCLYYDVPLDVDYTINSSLNAVREFLKEKGFVRNKYDEYHDEANGIWVAPIDQSLDFIIYVWKD